MFHAATDRNWFFCLMSHRCAKVVSWGGVHYFHRIFANFAVEQFGKQRWKANVKLNLMIYKNKKSDDYSLRNRIICLNESKKLRKAEPLFSTSRILFTLSSRVFAVEQFGIRRWKANKKTNRMT